MPMLETGINLTPVKALKLGALGVQGLSAPKSRRRQLKHKGGQRVLTKFREIRLKRRVIPYQLRVWQRVNKSGRLHKC